MQWRSKTNAVYRLEYAPVLSAFLWPVWWNAFANFDGYATSCF
ncbi:MAG: hypothetical protein QHJ82_16285 [Verrucomicrobiota bacterium]|nr:hypothetical protein [Verrucomicrobiota bacterium]